MMLALYFLDSTVANILMIYYYREGDAREDAAVVGGNEVSQY